jgi:hypothetical protein
MFKAKLLAVVGLGTAAYQFIISDGLMKLLQFKLLRMNEWLGMKEPWVFHERLDSYYYAASSYVPAILGTDIRQLGLRLTLDLAMFGIGGLMGMAVAASCLPRHGPQLRDPRADDDPDRRHRAAHLADGRAVPAHPRRRS